MYYIIYIYIDLYYIILYYIIYIYIYPVSSSVAGLWAGDLDASASRAADG